MPEYYVRAILMILFNLIINILFGIKEKLVLNA